MLAYFFLLRSTAGDIPSTNSMNWNYWWNQDRRDFIRIRSLCHTVQQSERSENEKDTAQPFCAVPLNAAAFATIWMLLKTCQDGVSRQAPSVKHSYQLFASMHNALALEPSSALEPSGNGKDTAQRRCPVSIVLFFPLSQVVALMLSFGHFWHLRGCSLQHLLAW